MARELKSIFDDLENVGDEDRCDKLATLKTAMGNYGRQELVEQMSSVSLEVLFDCLSSGSGDVIEETCDILRSLMLILDPVDCLQKYHESMLQGFHHPVPEVRTLVIAHLSRSLSVLEDSFAAQLLTSEYQDLLLSALNQLVSDELSVAKAAEMFITNLCKHKAGGTFVLGPAGLDSFRRILDSHESNDTIKFRVYETLAQIACLSPSYLDALENSSHSVLVQPLASVAADMSDPLNQMNALEILSVLVESDHGLQSVRDAHVLDKVKGMCQDWQNNPMTNTLFPGVIKFIGKMGAKHPVPDELIQLVMDSILRSNELDYALITVGLEALSFIGVTPQGKRTLDSMENLPKCWTRAKMVLDYDIDYQSRILEALAILFGSDEENLTCLPRWFQCIFKDISELFALVKVPFPDVSLAALKFLSAIAHLQWAQRHYLNSPGVVEFLVDRKETMSNECAMTKFKIISIIVESPLATKIISTDDMAKLRVYFNQGPFYAPAMAAVATEGAN